MDRQLACATYATLIPVLVLAGYFSAEYRTRGFETRTGRAFIWPVVVAVILGEWLGIVGTFLDPAPIWMVYSAGLCCTAVSGGLGVTLALTLTRAAGDERSRRLDRTLKEATDEIRRAGHTERDRESEN